MSLRDQPAETYDYRFEQRLVHYIGGPLNGREEVWEAGQSERVLYGHVPMQMPEGAYVPHGDGSFAKWGDYNAWLSRHREEQ